MSEFKGTPVPWVQHDSEYCPEEIWGDIDGPLEDGRVRGEMVCEINMGHPRAAENAVLIIEAGTVLHTTGRTPRELAERGEQLEAELERWRTLHGADNVEDSIAQDSRGSEARLLADRLQQIRTLTTERDQLAERLVTLQREISNSADKIAHDHPQLETLTPSAKLYAIEQCYEGVMKANADLHERLSVLESDRAECLSVLQAVKNEVNDLDMHLDGQQFDAFISIYEKLQATPDQIEAAFHERARSALARNGTE